MNESEYLQGELYERIEFAEAAYDIADRHRDEGEHNPIYGSEGGCFCRLLSEYLDTMLDEECAEEIRFNAATDLYTTSEEYYPHFVALLNGEDEDYWLEHMYDGDEDDDY